MMSVPRARSGIASRSLRDEPQVALAVVGAAHRLEQPARARLQRQVDVLADGGALGHRGDHRLAEVLRVRAREADPLDPRRPRRRHGGARRTRSRAPAEVAAPGVDVLAEQRDLLDAVLGEPRHLGDDLARAPALLAAADGGNDAVRALRVAAHRYLHPRAERPLAVHRQVAGEVLVRAEAAARCVPAGADPLAEVRDRARAERDVDLRVELEDPLPLRLRVAAADGDDELGVLPLACARVAEIGRELRVRLLADRARVEDEHVRVLLRSGLAEPERLEHALDPLRVVSVHLAAERRDVVAPHSADSLAPASAITRPGRRSRAGSRRPPPAAA